MTDLDKEIIRLRNLKQNKKRTLSEIEKEAKINVFTKQIDIESRFKNTKDQKLAKKLFDHYTQNHIFETFVEYKVVADLVFEEILLEHTKDALDQIHDNNTNQYVSEKHVKTLHETQERVYFLQKKLGIVKEESADDLSALEMLKKKFSLWNVFNRNECTLYAPYKCSDCGKEDVQPLLLRRRVKDFDVIPHCMLRGRFLFNVEIFHDLEQGLITDEQAARYMRTSSAYIKWVKENINKIVEVDGFSRDEINAYIQNIPHLIDKYKKQNNLQ